MKELNLKKFLTVGQSPTHMIFYKTFKIFKENFCKREISKCSKHANIQTSKYPKHRVHLKSQQ